MPPDLIELGNLKHGLLIAQHLRKPYIPKVDFVVSRSSGGRLLGGVIYNNYTGISVAHHIAGFVPNWMSRALIWWAFEYPFGMLKVQKMLGIVSTGNVKSHRLALHMGFTEECRVHDVVRDGALVILSMVPAACRWRGERPRNNQVIMHPGG